MAVDPISATLIATIKAAKVFAASKAKGALVKSTVKKTVKSKAKSIAKDKLLGRGKKKKKGTQPEGEGQEQQQEEETGGALVKAGSSSIIPTGLATSTAAIAKSSGGGDAGPVPDTLEGIVTKIKVTTISVEKLLGSQAALIKQRQKDKHIADEKADDKAQEKALEKSKIKGGKGPKLLKKVPGKGLFGQIFGFLTNVLFGWLLIKLIPLLPMLTSWLPKLGAFVEGYLNFIGWFYDVAITALAAIIDVGNSLVETMKGWVTNIFGEEGAQKFETFMNSLRDLINGFLVWKIIGEKIFKAVVGAITRTWKIVKGAIVKAWKIAKIGIEAAWKAARNVGGWVGKNLMKIPGVSQVVGKVGSLASTAVKGVGTLASKGAGVVSGWASQLFGKAAGVVAPALKAAAPAVKGFASRIPILGPIIVALVSLMSGEDIGQALFKGVGAALGGALGTFIPIPFLGTLLGETIGAFVGDLLYYTIMERNPAKAFDLLKNTVMGIFGFLMKIPILGDLIRIMGEGGNILWNFGKWIFLDAIPWVITSLGGAAKLLADWLKAGMVRFEENFPVFNLPLLKFRILGINVDINWLLGKAFGLIPWFQKWINSEDQLMHFPDFSMFVPMLGLPFLVGHLGKSLFPGSFFESWPSGVSSGVNPIGKALGVKMKEGQDEVAEMRQKIKEKGLWNALRDKDDETESESGKEQQAVVSDKGTGQGNVDATKEITEEISNYPSYDPQSGVDQDVEDVEPSDSDTKKEEQPVKEVMLPLNLDTTQGRDPYEILYMGG